MLRARRVGLAWVAFAVLAGGCTGKAAHGSSATTGSRTPTAAGTPVSSPSGVGATSSPPAGPTPAPSLTGAPTPRPSPSLAGWGAVVLPELNCLPIEGPAVRQVTYVQHAGGPAQALVLAACEGTGDQPSGLYAYDLGPGGHGSRLAQVLISNDAANGGGASSFTANASRIDLQQQTFSTELVPKCCPDIWFDSRWTWSGTTWAGPVTAATYPSPLAVTVVARPSPVRPGSHVTYTITLANRSGTTIWAVWSDTIAEGTTFVASPTCSPGPPEEPGQLQCGPQTMGVGSGTKLDPGASTTTTITVAVGQVSSPITNKLQADAAWPQNVNLNGPPNVYVETSTTVLPS